MNRQMKKAVNMVLAFVLAATTIPVQTMNAAEDVLVVDDQDVAVISREDNFVLREGAIADNNTDILSPELEIIDDGLLLAENPEETFVDKEASGTDYETEMESEIDVEKKIDQESGMVSKTEMEEGFILAVEDVCEKEEYAADSVGEEQNYEGFNYVLADDGTIYENSLKIAVDQAEEVILYTMPEIEKFQDLWVGDQISIGVKYNYGMNDNLSSMDVISGEECISIVENGQEGSKSWMITCEKEGEVNLHVNFNDRASEPIELKLIIRQKPEVKVIFATDSLKLGGRLDTLFENVSYGSYPDIYIGAKDAEKFEIYGMSGSVALDDFFCVERWKKRSFIFYNKTMDDGSIWVSPVGKVVCPGTIELMFYPYWGEFGDGKKPEQTFSMVIQEPVIHHNAKEICEIGEEQELSVRLDNTDYEDEPLSHIKDGTLITSSEGTRWIYYVPKLELLSGQDCVDFVGEANVTTLTLKQKLRFKKAGMVQLKVTFEPSGVNASVNTVYRPEKVFTIQVKEEDVTAIFDSAGGSKIASQTVTSGSCIKMPEIPIRSGYKFLGWYQENAEFDFSKPITANVTLTAQWEKLNVKATSIKLNETILKLKNGQTYKLTTTINPLDATKKVVDWRTSNRKVATVSGGKITAKGLGTATITAKTTDGSGILASCKVIVGHTIKYQLNGGTNNSKNPAVYYKENISLKNPTRKGYLFKGWYTDKKYKKKITKITTKNKDNLTLYAKWEKISVGKTAISTLKNVISKNVFLKYRTISKASGYEVLYSTDVKFNKNCTTVLTKKSAFTIKGLIKKKTYYVKVRAYRTDSAGKKVYGKYSAVKKVKITK